MLDKPRGCGFDPTKKTCCQPVVDCTYWPLLGSSIAGTLFNLQIKQYHKDFDEVHNLVLDGISENMSSLLQVGKYGAIDAVYPTTMGY